MKTRIGLSLSLAAAFLICFHSKVGSSQVTSQTPPESTSTSTQATSDAPTAPDYQAAKQMVPAEVNLTQTLDARKDQPGSKFEAKLKGTVHLKDGTELPHGTVLVGQVTSDQMQNNGTSQLALRFTEAKLNNGKTVPIQATIVGLVGPIQDSQIGSDSGPTPWDGTSLKYDVVGVMSHVDLHSTLGGANSGTLVANDKSDMKLAMHSRLSLALSDKTAD
jgi:hypothetical protein